MGIAIGVQGSFDELGTPLREQTFVVVDLETTGTDASQSRITEIGAVKIRGGEVLGEFQTLVDPQAPIPPFITVLTGITEAMVAGAPPIGTALPMFLEFARGCVLVAHNARFDVGFLKAACAQTDQIWAEVPVVDTAQIARKTLHRDEVPNCKLATLAQFFSVNSRPSHRALADARATAEVFHRLLERLGGLGVESFEELRGFSSRVPVEQRRKRHLAQGLPETPGVYLFMDDADRVLYVGSATSLRSRVRGYFTASEQRSRMAEMVRLAERVDSIECAIPLEAQVRELRLIAEHKPRYNRRSKHPERAAWVKLTVEPFPRLSVVHSVRSDGAAYVGPFASSRSAEEAVAALHETFPIRQCRARLSVRRPSPACVLAEMHRCTAPCDGSTSVEEYATLVAQVAHAMAGDARPVRDAMLRRIEALSATARYEEAAVHRDRLTAFVRGAARAQRLTGLAVCRELVAARPGAAKGWELAVVRYGRLAGASTVPNDAPSPWPYIEALVATSETVRDGSGPAPAALPEETECVLRWLEHPGVRLASLDGTWCSPAFGAGSLRGWLEEACAGGVMAEAPRNGGLRPIGPVPPRSLWLRPLGLHPETSTQPQEVGADDSH